MTPAPAVASGTPPSTTSWLAPAFLAAPGRARFAVYAGVAAVRVASSSLILLPPTLPARATLLVDSSVVHAATPALRCCRLLHRTPLEVVSLFVLVVFLTFL